MSSFSRSYQLDDMNSMQVLLLKIQPGQIAAFEGQVSLARNDPTSVLNILQGWGVQFMGIKKTPQGKQEFNVPLLKIQPGHIAAYSLFILGVGV